MRLSDYRTENKNLMKKLFAWKGHTDIYQPHMPEVDAPEKIEDIFAEARRAARGETRPPGART